MILHHAQQQRGQIVNTGAARVSEYRGIGYSALVGTHAEHARRVASRVVACDAPRVHTNLPRRGHEFSRGHGEGFSRDVRVDFLTIRPVWVWVIVPCVFRKEAAVWRSVRIGGIREAVRAHWWTCRCARVIVSCSVFRPRVRTNENFDQFAPCFFVPCQTG